MWVQDNGVYKEAKVLYTYDDHMWKEVAGGGLPALGSEFEGGYFIGVTGKYDSWAIIASPKALGESPTPLRYTKYTWSTPFYDRVDGLLNTTNMLGHAPPSDDFPAAQFCWDLVINGKEDWYLPATEELKMLAINRHFLPSAEQLGSFAYWTSTADSNYIGDAFAVNSLGGEVRFVKDNTNYVRAVRRVPLG